MSSQEPNRSKSSIFFSPGTDTTIQRDIKNYLRVQKIQPTKKYLGMCLVGGRIQTEFNKKLFEKTQSRLTGWKMRTLSHAGKEILIKSSLASLHTYIMTTSNIDKNVCHKLNFMHRDFWWRFDNRKRHCYLTAWANMQKSRDEGGLAIKNMLHMNQAFNLKLAWRFLTEQNSPWVKIVKEKYLSNQNFWDSSANHNSFKSWKNMLSAREVL